MTFKQVCRSNAQITSRVAAAVLTHIVGTSASAQTTNLPAGLPTPQAARLPDVVVVGEAEYSESIQGPFLPDLQETRINAGKKTSVLDLDQLPKVNNNNYRQALTKTPGLLLSEETSPLVSIGYRGLNPHRAQFTQVLKDGIPIHADQFGYPEAYYTPPLDTVDRIEFLHGGASLMYGPQPGGALNYVTHRPRTDKPFSARTQQTFGSDNLYSTFTSVDGTINRVGYYAYFNYRTSDGFREANSDFDVYAGSAKLILNATSNSRWVFNFDGYAEEHGEPGGLAIDAGPDYNLDREATTRFFDRFELERYFASLAWERDFSENTALTVTGWGGYYARFSKRQRGGSFGTLPTGPNANSNTIELQEFYTEGVEARLRHDWTSGGQTHTLAAGVQLYHTASPRTDERGATPGADHGQLRNESQRETIYAPLFLENRFAFEGFSITPGVRLENIYQGVEEELNLDKQAAGTPLGDESEFDFVPLFGLGLEYQFPGKLTGYGNISQAYRPKVFTEAVPTGGTSVINDDLQEGSSVQYEIGLRGLPTPWLYFDTSLFWLDLDNQIGSVAVPGGTSIENVGHAVHRGWEGALEVELFALARAFRGEHTDSPEHQLSIYGNAILLDAQFVGGPRKGMAPQYAPDYLFRAGAIYRWHHRAKLALTGTFVDSHYADDANSENFFVPAYMVWDLALDWNIYRDHVSLLAGINNLFNEDYYARIRGDGIDPAYGRNFYAGFALAF